MINEAVGDKVDVVFTCGTDFGTQNSTFCSPETYDRVWMPYYRKVNDWIHLNTNWKTFKHSCGAVESLMDHFIDSGFDIINPVQINASGMDPRYSRKNMVIKSYSGAEALIPRVHLPSEPLPR